MIKMQEQRQRRQQPVSAGYKEEKRELQRRLRANCRRTGGTK